ncbi:hypothetical protein RA955_17255 [Geobacillus proteiniphilus]|uniref:O-antigen flippase Wzx n=1 Tax=Geobacillus proteiniphilus TaxID=860353 RepID=A0ABY9MEB0_9BACL|nr:hypothetical protein [Geobacillus proteiniphilus]WMJ16353.1 hypothetical protein RA955_17255 [Geobacillus proteiniphilus]
MRHKYALINSTIGITLFIISTILLVVRRSVMINTLGADFVAINALFNDILMLLNIADIGLWGAVGAVLFKPIREQNYIQIKGIISFFKKVYRIIGSIFIIFSMIVVFVIGYFFDHPEITDNQIRFYFTLTAINIAYTYYFSYRMILKDTDQKLYYLSFVITLCKAVATIFQIIFLIFLKSFTVYLVIDFLTTIIYISIFNRIITRKYSFLKECDSEIDKDIKDKIIRSLKGLVFHKLGYLALNSTNYLYTALFSGLKMTAIYSNYQMIIVVIQGLINNLFTSINSTIGNIIIGEDSEKRYINFRILFLINFWLVSLAAILFYNTSSSFMSFWVGTDYIAPNNTVALFTAYIFFGLIRAATEQFKFASGVFYEDRFIPLIEAFVNVVSCLLLGKEFGITGIVAGNLLTVLLITTWQKPYIVFKYVFHRSLREYFKLFILFLIIGMLALYISNKMCILLNSSLSISNYIFIFIVNSLITVFVVNIIYVLFFWNTQMFKMIRKYTINAIKLVTIQLPTREN